MKQRITLTDQERRAVVRLLGALQDHLESVIECRVVPGETEPREPHLRPIIAQDRRDWQAAEKLVKRLTERKAAK